MSTLTVANQVTLVRMLLIPAFVLLVLYNRPGWALATFVAAGITDALDGLIARWAKQRTSLGAWLDPMADKLLLVSAFVVLTVPNTGMVNRFPLWLTVLVISRDVVIVLTVAVVNLAVGGRTFTPSVYGKVATGVYIVTCGVVILFELSRTPVGARGRGGLRGPRHHADFRRPLHRPRGAHYQSAAGALRQPGIVPAPVLSEPWYGSR